MTDPYAGVATTLVHLGVPAVVAMQFEISDEAAILFAEELYTNLIGRQDPLDSAIGEARKAIYAEVDLADGADAAAGDGLRHGGHHLLVLAHAEIVVGTPHGDLGGLAVRLAPLRRGEAPGDALDIGEDAVAALAVQLVEGAAEVALVARTGARRSRLGEHRAGHPGDGHRASFACSAVRVAPVWHRCPAIEVRPRS